MRLCLISSKAVRRSRNSAWRFQSEGVHGVLRPVGAVALAVWRLHQVDIVTSYETGAIATIDKAPSPLRQRMVEDMTIRHFKEKVQKDYIRHVKITAFLG